MAYFILIPIQRVYCPHIIEDIKRFLMNTKLTKLRPGKMAGPFGRSCRNLFFVDVNGVTQSIRSNRVKKIPEPSLVFQIVK